MRRRSSEELPQPRPPIGEDTVQVAGDEAAVRSLLAGGANAKAADENRVTLVMRAAETGNAEIVRMLLAAGGDPTARDRDGRNAADRARDGLANGKSHQYELILKLLVDEQQVDRAIG